MVDVPLSTYSLRTLTHVLGHDSGNLVGRISVDDINGDAREKLTADRAYYVRFNLGVCTMTIASPAVATRAAHGLSAGNQVAFSLPLDAYPSVYASSTSISIASPGVVTINAHGYSVNDPIKFRTTDALPTGITAGTIYYVRNPTANTFEFSATSGGASINTSGSQSGVQRIERASSLPTGVTEGQIYHVLTTPTADTFTFSATAGGAAINTTGTQAGKITLQTGNNNNTGLTYTQADALMTVQAGVDKAQLLDFNARRVSIYLDASVYLTSAGAFTPVISIYNQSASVGAIPSITAAVGGGQLYIRGLDDNDHSKVIIRSLDYSAVVIIGFQPFGIALRKLAFESGFGEHAIRMDGPIGAHPIYLEHLALLDKGSGSGTGGLVNSHGVSIYYHGMVEVIGNPNKALFTLGEASYFFYIAPGLDYFQGVIGFGVKTSPKGMFWASRNSTVYINNQAKFTGVWNCPKCWLDAGAVFQHSLEDDNYGIEIPGTAPVILGGSCYVIDDQDSGLSTSVSGLTTLKLGGYGAAPALSLFGSTSGSSTIKAAAVAGSPADLTLPTTSGTSGHFLQTDGSGVLSWAAGGGGGGGTPGGSPGQLQYNNAGAFGGVAGSVVGAGGLTVSGDFYVTQTSNPNGATMNTYYNKASPVANDRIGEWHFYANNASVAQKQYAAIYAESPTITAGAEAGRLVMNVAEAGSPRVIFEYDGSTKVLNLSATSWTWDTRLSLDNVKGLQAFAVTNSSLHATPSLRIGVGTSSNPMLVFNGSATQGWAIDNLSGDLRFIKDAAAVPFMFTNARSVVFGVGGVSASATDGFVYIPACVGTPTGVPTAHGGTVPMVYDTTNNKLYVYNGGWKGGTNPGAFT